jgi:inositol transport system permease protein
MTIQNLRKQIKPEKYITIIILLGMCLLIMVIKHQFVSPTNLFAVLQQACVFGIIAPGATFIIISGGIDLSAGAILAFSGVIGAAVGQTPAAAEKILPWLPQMPFIVPIIVTLITGILCGTVNGLLIAKAGAPPFIATLGLTTIMRGLALLVSSGRPVSTVIPGYQIISYRIFNIIPVMVLIFLAVIVLCYLLLNNTRLGSDIYAIGSNPRAAIVSGVRVPRITISVYAMAGLLYSIAAIVMTGKSSSIHPGAAVGYELTAIAAAIIGGTSPLGGMGTIGGTLVGVLIISVLRNGLSLFGVESYWQQVAEGLVILAACLADIYRSRK